MEEKQEYSYTALNIDGKKVSGIIIAKDDGEARSIISSQKLDVINITKKMKFTNWKIFKGNQKLNAQELINVLLNIAELDKIGMPLINIAEVLEEDVATPGRMQKFCKKVHNFVKSGSTLSSAFENQPDAVDPIFANFIKIAESTGDYYTILTKAIEYIKWTDKIKRSVRTASIKATISISFIIGLIVVISLIVIPQTMSFLKDSGIPIPWYTIWMVKMSNFIVNKYLLFIGLVAFAIVLITLIMKLSSFFKIHVDKFKLKLPFFGSLLVSIEAVRFTSFFSIMYEAGVKIETIFDETKNIIKNKYINEQLSQVKQLIVNGSPVSQAMVTIAPFPIRVLKMMRIGFDSGNIPEVMNNTKYFLDRDVTEKTDILVSSIKPIILIITGLLVGWMAIAVFGPIYTNLGNFSDNNSSKHITDTRE